MHRYLIALIVLLLSGPIMAHDDGDDSLLTHVTSPRSIFLRCAMLRSTGNGPLPEFREDDNQLTLQIGGRRFACPALTPAPVKFKPNGMVLAPKLQAKVHPDGAYRRQADGVIADCERSQRLGKLLSRRDILRCAYHASNRAASCDTYAACIPQANWLHVSELARVNVEQMPEPFLREHLALRELERQKLEQMLRNTGRQGVMLRSGSRHYRCPLLPTVGAVYLADAVFLLPMVNHEGGWKCELVS